MIFAKQCGNMNIFNVYLSVIVQKFCRNNCMNKLFLYVLAKDTEVYMRIVLCSDDNCINTLGDILLILYGYLRFSVWPQVS